MQRGDIVTIYQDPVTQKNPEGQARLTRLIAPDDGDGMSRWVVRFLDDDSGQGYTRSVFQPPAPTFSERELRAICAEEIEVACDFDGYSPQLLVEHIAHCYCVPEVLNRNHPVWGIAEQLCYAAETESET